jgi:alkanesulfonate monooxygenase SsuD/methylene tetrahydromethanopterin reductase-like flavin-dependent oxidoreductase (luciferase family)
VRCGITLYIQGYQDWDRYEAAERGESVPRLDPTLDAKRFSEELESALKFEGLGFDSIWTVEHHVSPYTMVTNPIQLLTFFAGATSRIDVGTMVVVLPWHHPLRVAEDMTMLQYALRGRQAYIGFGRGAARREFTQLGFDMNESRERFIESVHIIRKALTEEAFSFRGDHYNIERATMRPRPRDAQALVDNMHFSWGSATSAPVGAKLGLKPLIIPQKAWADYHADLAEFSRVRTELGLPLARPRIHMNVYCAETEEKARRNAHIYVPQYADSATRNYEMHGSHFKDIKGYEHYAERAAAISSKQEFTDRMARGYLENHVWGTPEQCITKLKFIADQFHPEEFMMVMRFGTMPQDVSDDSITLFAREVLPAVHEIKTLDPVKYAEAA